MKAILCFGDSITFGVGEIPCKGWCGRLKEWFESEPYRAVYNLGIPGETSTDLLRRFDAECDRIKLKRPGDSFIIVVAIGTNDSRKEQGNEQTVTPKALFRKNITELIKKAKEYEAKTIFIGLTPVHMERTSPFEDTFFTQEQVERYNTIIKEECDGEVPFLDVFSLMSAEEYTTMLADGLHPNAKGYQYLYVKIREFLEKKGLNS